MKVSRALPLEMMHQTPNGDFRLNGLRNIVYTMLNLGTKEMLLQTRLS